jgi:hypothetical protein
LRTPFLMSTLLTTQRKKSCIQDGATQAAGRWDFGLADVGGHRAFFYVCDLGLGANGVIAPGRFEWLETHLSGSGVGPRLRGRAYKVRNFPD